MRTRLFFLLATFPLVLNGVEVVAGITAFTTIVSSLSSLIPGAGLLKSVLGGFSLLGDMVGDIDGVFSTDPNADVLNAISSLSTKMDDYYRGITTKIDNLQYEMVKLSFTNEVTGPIGELDEMMLDVLKKPKSEALKKAFLLATSGKNVTYNLAVKISQKMKDSSTSMLNAVIQKDSMYKGTEPEFSSIVSYVKGLLNKLVIINAFDYGLRQGNRKVTKQFKNNTLFKGMNSTQIKDWYAAEFLKNYPTELYDKTVEISKYMDDFLETYKNKNPYWTDGTLDNIVTLSINPKETVKSQAETIQKHLKNIYTYDNFYIVVSDDLRCTNVSNSDNVFYKESGSIVAVIIRIGKGYIKRNPASESRAPIMDALMLNIGKGNPLVSTSCLVDFPQQPFVKFLIVFTRMGDRTHTSITYTLPIDNALVWIGEVPSRLVRRLNIAYDRTSVAIATLL